MKDSFVFAGRALVCAVALVCADAPPARADSVTVVGAPKGGPVTAAALSRAPHAWTPADSAPLRAGCFGIAECKEAYWADAASGGGVALERQAVTLLAAGALQVAAPTVFARAYVTQPQGRTARVWLDFYDAGRRYLATLSPGELPRAPGTRELWSTPRQTIPPTLYRGAAFVVRRVQFAAR